MKTLLEKGRLFLMGWLLIASWRAAAALPTCAECSQTCMDQYYDCLVQRDIAYEFCIEHTPPENWDSCDQAYDYDTELCEQAEIDCETYDCVPRVHCAVDPPDSIPGEPLDPAPVPIKFARKGGNTLSNQGKLVANTPSSASVPSTHSTEFRMTFQVSQRAGGADFPIPSGYSHVSVKVEMNSRPLDLLGARIVFGNDPAPGAHGKRGLMHTSSAIRPFEAGRLEVAGNVLRVEPLVVNPQPGDVVIIRVTPSK